MHILSSCYRPVGRRGRATGSPAANCSVPWHSCGRWFGVQFDWTPQYMSHVFQEELRFLGITSSPAFVREPEGNGCAERFIRTLKENLLWLTTFDTVEELRLALHEFQRQYNETWLIGRHGYKTTARVRQEQRCALADAA